MLKAKRAEEEMSPKRLRIEEKHYCNSDPLNSLPDELLLLVFSKITDPKTLFLSSFISNQIASILFHSQSLSLQFPTRLIPFFDDIPMTKTFGDISLPLTNLLHRFHGVRSLRIELPRFCRCPDDIAFKWRAKAGVRWGILSFLSTKFVSKIDDKNVEAENEEEEEEHLVLPFPLEVIGPFLYASKMYLMMLLLISRGPNLDNIELVDSKKHGKLSLQGEELIKLRRAENLELMWSLGHQKIWYAPKVRLPLSGFEMKEVALVVIRGDRVANRKRSGSGGGVGEEVEGNVEDALMYSF